MPDVIHGHIQKEEFGHVLLDELELRVATQVGDVVDRASDEIVDADDPMSSREEQVRQMRAEEAGGPRDDAGWAGRVFRRHIF